MGSNPVVTEVESAVRSIAVGARTENQSLLTTLATTKFGYFGYVIMAAAFVLPFCGVSFFMFWNHIGDPKVFVSLAMICLFVFVTMSTIGLIVLGSAGELNISEDFLKWLAGATIAEVAGIVLIIVKAYFAVA